MFIGSVLLLSSALSTAWLPSAARQAHSPEPGGVAPAASTRVYVDLAQSKSGFDCSPRPIGPGTLPKLRSNDAGTVVWWYCPTPTGAWRVNWAAATAAQLSAKHLLAELHNLLGASDPKRAFDDMVARNVTVPLSDGSLEPVWRPYLAEMLAGAPKALRNRSNAVASSADSSAAHAAVDLP